MVLFLQVIVNETIFDAVFLQCNTEFNTIFCLGGTYILNMVSKVFQIDVLILKGTFLSV